MFMVKAVWTARVCRRPRGTRRRHAVTVLLDLVAARPGATLCALGPLTNVASAIVQRPDIMATVKQIVLMGGAAGAGNVTPHAEFNFYCDPHAARIVFERGIPIVMHGLDVTRHARVDAAWLDRVAAADTAVTRAVAGMMGRWRWRGRQPARPAGP